MADIIGTADNDTLIGSDDSDRISGEGGNDYLAGGLGDDNLKGGDGQDLLYGGADDDTLAGGAGDDTLAGEDGNNSLYGGGGDDYLSINSAAPYAQQVSRSGFADGGAGHNTFYVSFADLPGDHRADFSGLDHGEIVRVGGFGLANFDHGQADFGAGDDTVRTGDFDISIAGGDGDDRVIGGKGANQLSGQAGDDVLSGGGGDDTLDGGEGHDRLLGGAGADLLTAQGPTLVRGGGGDDVLTGGGYGATLDGGQGHDSLTMDLSLAPQSPDIDLRHMQHGVTIAFADSMLDISLARIETITLSLSQLGERIHTGEVEARVNGAQGNDWIKAGHGTLEAYGSDGDDTIIGGTGADFLNGNDGDDVVRGGDGNDSISGSDGIDRLSGGAGDDFFFIYRQGFDSSPDILSGGAGADVFDYASLLDGRITDLDSLDTIDLRSIDADETTSGDQAFRQVAAFDGQAGEMTVTYHAKHGVTLVELDVDGDGAADATLTLVGDHHDFTGFTL